MIGGIVSLSAGAVLADFRYDRRIVAEVDQDPLVRVCVGVEVRSAAGSLTGEQMDATRTILWWS
jgi:hypothetical protein